MIFGIQGLGVDTILDRMQNELTHGVSELSKVVFWTAFHYYGKSVRRGELYSDHIDDISDSDSAVRK